MFSVAEHADDSVEDGITAVQTLNGSRSAKTPPRSLLLVLPMLIVASVTGGFLATRYLSSYNSSTFSNFESTMSDTTKNYLNSGENRTNSDLENTATAHPHSRYYQRGERFDRSIRRDRAIMICMIDEVLAMGLSLIRELRCLGNEELVQVYHCGQDELSTKSKAILFSSDNRIELVDVCSDLVEKHVITQEMANESKNWWIKPLAMYHTDVRHVILMDVDDIIVKDPTVLRELDGYKRMGALFFYDRVLPDCTEFLNDVDDKEKYLPSLLRNFNYDKFNISRERNLPNMCYNHSPTQAERVMKWILP
ncbi:putative Mannosyltransferase [Phytophthora infestans]|uniref:Putative Mannosyltransferase n=1 Tax=Phytophthora infestans TaxID=4787 RepID=A0A833T7I7_PHYIN|nr:putative Mannosyltransferase [Phytophthora infestans]